MRTVSQTVSASRALVRVSVQSEGRRLDIGIPGQLPLVELMPGFARSLGVLDKIRMVYVHASEARYIIMSKHLPPSVQQRLRLAVDQLERSGELRRIADRHLK